MSSGTYIVDVSNPVTGCTFSLTENITPISTYDIDTNSTNITCDSAFNGTISITEYNLSNPVYSWVGPNGYTSNLEDLDSLSAGNYQVLINDDYNCPTIYSFDIKEPTAIALLSSVSNVSLKSSTLVSFKKFGKLSPLLNSILFVNSVSSLSLSLSCLDSSHAT